jgi:hypothetical protein
MTTAAKASNHTDSASEAILGGLEFDQPVPISGHPVITQFEVEYDRGWTIDSGRFGRDHRLRMACWWAIPFRCWEALRM